MRLFSLKLRKARHIDWPSVSVPHNGKLHNLADVFRSVGIDLKLTLDPEPIADHPRGASFDLSDLHGLLSERPPIIPGGPWQATALIVPSIAYMSGHRVRRPQGVMFDIGAADGGHRAREGCAVAWHAIGMHPAVYLRTLAHEIGHLLNLMHPDEDVPAVHSGSTLMFETRSLARSRTYPDNIKFEFSEANQNWLRTAPEDFVRPGGEPYGSRPWRHVSATIPPTDAGPTSPTNSGSSPRDPAGLGLSLDVLTSHPLPWIPIEFEVRLSAARELSPLLCIDLDPAGGELSLETLTADQRWQVIPAVVRDCGHPRESCPADGQLSQAVMLPGACLRGEERRVFRARYQHRMADGRKFDVRSAPVIVDAAAPRTAAERLVSAVCASFNVRLAVCWGGFSSRLAQARQQVEVLRRQVDFMSVAPRLAGTLANARRRTSRSGLATREARPLTKFIQHASSTDQQRYEAEFLDGCCVNGSRFPMAVR